ncbi:MAG: polyprenyl synthetase family protein [archaeon]|nr:polyprenyl synthetase family protein [archaeon]
MLATERLNWLGRYVESIDVKIAQLFAQNPTSALERAVADSLSNGGKRVRAVLGLLMCELFSGEFEEAIPIAVAYELAHASALVQDDIIDASELRRGTRSIVSKYGLSNAILASDLLLFNVPKMIAKYDKLESSKLAKLFDLVGEACRGATWGEFLDLEMAKREDGVSELEYEEMIRCKTATLLAAPSASGAIIGGASEEETNLAYKFGEWLGMAYQIQDDALDLFGNELTLGKPIFTDIRAGKKNLILIHCLNHCTEKERKFLFSLFNRIGEYDQDEVSKARAILEIHGSLRYSRKRSTEFVQEAKRLLVNTGTSKAPQARSSLLELAGYISERYY